jgi:sigma-B regulation protein RsbU (phosphoserine phosphatase)
VLGHDLRNPLASIGAGMRLLQRAAPNEKANAIITLMQQSVARMSALIDNVLDFARGRLGGGLAMTRSRDLLEPVLRQVIAELQSTHPERIIQAEIDLTEPVFADRVRIGQLLSNLLGNALMYGAEGEPVRVRASTVDRFELSVSNAGDPIAPAAMQRLFQPFARGDARPSQQGLGLGLYIASEIALAHGGKIEVASSAAETRFTFTMPLESGTAN